MLPLTFCFWNGLAVVLNPNKLPLLVGALQNVVQLGAGLKKLYNSWSYHLAEGAHAAHVADAAASAVTRRGTSGIEHFAAALKFGFNVRRFQHFCNLSCRNGNWNGRSFSVLVIHICMYITCG